MADRRGRSQLFLLNYLVQTPVRSINLPGQANFSARALGVQ
jgi:hypothetical protein